MTTRHRQLRSLIRGWFFPPVLHFFVVTVDFSHPSNIGLTLMSLHVSLHLVLTFFELRYDSVIINSYTYILYRVTDGSMNSGI